MSRPISAIWLGIAHRRQVEQLLDADGRRALANRLDLALQQRPDLLRLLRQIDAELARRRAAAGERLRNAAHDEQHVRLDRVQMRAVDQRGRVRRAPAR